MASLDNPEPVNLARSIFLCNIFTFFFAASKACLFPFLTIFLKKLGLSATYTGAIIGCKTLVGFIFAPLWAKCAVRCGRRRCMLMFSLFMMALTYLSLTAIPSMNSAFTIKCAGGYRHVNISNELSDAKTKTKPDFEANETEKITKILSTTLIPSNENSSAQMIVVTGRPEVDITQFSNNSQTVKPTTKVPKAATFKTTKVPAEDAVGDELTTVLKQLLVKTGIAPDDLKGLTSSELLEYIDESIKKNGIKQIADALEELPEETANKLINLVYPGVGRKKRDYSEDFQKRQSEILHKLRTRQQEEVNDNANDDDTPNDEDETKSSWSALKRTVYEKLKKILGDVTETEKKMFVIILVILMVGEMFSSPIEKVADDSWYEFLESIDDLEKYGMHRVWSSFAFILLPIIVTLAVDNTTCLFGLSLHSFMLHFYLFGVFLGITFLLAFFYPMSTSEKYKYASKVGKGMKIVCCSSRGLLYSITLLIMGIVYSSYYNFLFWMLIDMGSKEITLGLCLTIAALAEIPMLLFNDMLVKKIGNGGVVALSVFLLSGRVLYYSFLPTPWAVLPAELLHAFTHTATWWAVLSSPSFNVSPALSRSIRSIFSSIYFGIGFAVGSIVSGLIYDHFGSAILFQAGAVMAIAWFPVLLCAVMCCRESDKTDVKYTKLLTSDNDSSDLEDDWLEHALKNK